MKYNLTFYFTSCCHVENVCLAFKIKAQCHLEAEIIGNICFMAAILENGRHVFFCQV